MPITVNVAGQVGQIKLSTAKALWPLFETVINSIQSLEDSDAKEKKIIIEALRPNHIQLKTDGQGHTAEEPAHFEAFTVTDNGNGFNTENYNSFLEAYSQLKVKKGCKGIGRGFVKQLNRPMVTIIGRFLCYALARQRPGLPCVKGAVSEAD